MASAVCLLDITPFFGVHVPIYPEFARMVDEEGFAEIAAVFRSIMVAEQNHEERYVALLSNLAKGTVLKKAGPTQVALPELRPYPRRHRGPRGMPGLRPPSSVL